MSPHKVLDFDTPLAPEDIEPGNIILLHGKPRTIAHVDPYTNLSGRFPEHGTRLYADLGSGDKQTFYVFTCGHCKVRRAFPGLDQRDWYAVSHGGVLRVFCSAGCLLEGVMSNV